MHQTFYIDSDEEISSVIDKLNKSVSVDNFFVVPKRALFLQSIVNLKLLKREADKLGKNLIIVTQDEIGASMAERSGLQVQSSIVETESHEAEVAQPLEEEEEEFEVEIPEIAPQSKKSRLHNVGSNEFYDITASISHQEEKIHTKTKTPAKKIHVNSVNSVSHAKSPRHFSGDITPRQTLGSKTPQRTDMHVQTEKKVRPHVNGINPGKEEILEKMFSSVKPPKNDSAQKVLQVGNTAKKIFISFIVLCCVLFVGVAVFLFLPSAKIKITLNNATEKTDLNISGQADITQVNGLSVPVRVVDKEDNITLSYDVTGSSAGQGKKAHGNVVIYNEFSSESQTLIATTRIQSSDGKIFRLVKNVVVPGSTSIAGQTKPGAIEAEVVADAPGSEYNIAPTLFNIPGFSGGPKFDKFYAKSTVDFVGGSSDGANTASTVSQSDIDVAKQKTEKAISEKLAKEITDALNEGDISLQQAEKVTIVKSSTTARIGDMSGKFDYTVSASIHALVFSENDIKSVIRQSFKGNKYLENTTWDVSKVEYGASLADFDKNTLSLKIHGEVLAVPIVDEGKIKAEFLGKKADQLDAVLKLFPAIKGVNVEFWPTFVSRIPQYDGRVGIEIEKTHQ